jgi:HEAT repeat protein
VERLAAVAGDGLAAARARAAALRALEGIGDERALAVALRAAGDADAEVAVAGIALARTFLGTAREIEALDGLAAVLLDRARPDRVREAAWHALRDLDRATVNPIVEALLTDPSPRLREAARGGSGSPVRVAGDWLSGDAAWPLPDDVETVRDAIARQGADTPLPHLLRLIERIRERESRAAAPERRRWLGARAAAHVALGTRGSRLAVYDLREALDTATEPLPVEFLAALTLAGDSSCLEPIAGAFARAAGTDAAGAAGSAPRALDDDWWRQHLADAFHAIVAREGITRRHAIARKIERRWPGAAADLWPARRRAR